MASGKKTGVSAIDDDDDDLEEEPGEVIESAPPMRVGEERPLNRTAGLVKKLLRRGSGWETPEPGDEATGTSLSLLQFSCGGRAGARGGTGRRRRQRAR